MNSDTADPGSDAGIKTGAGYFPFYIGLLICIASAVVGFGAIRHAAQRGKVFVTYAQLRLVMTVLLPSLAFVVGVQLLGIYVAR
jgi:hypothetical protein